MRNANRHQATVFATAVVVGCAFVLSACVEVGLPAGDDTTWGRLNPARGMHDQPSSQDQETQPRPTDEGGWEEGPMRVPPAETLPQRTSPTAYEGAEETAVPLENPVNIDEESLRYGREAYETSCAVCHGEVGGGNGYIDEDNFDRAPPSLTSQTARDYSDARLFEIISEGTGSMWGYDEQLYAIERWAVVNYVRALQRAEFPEPHDRQLLDEN
ncbi:MAG: c-type cytochrome [Persicimonas sp.]